MTGRGGAGSRRLRPGLPARRILVVFAALLGVGALPCVVYAVRANWGVRALGPRLERTGQHEEAAFYHRAALDFYTVIQQLWMDAVYDKRVDEIYRQYVSIFGTDKGFRGANHEEHQDNAEACLVLFNREGAARNVAKGRFSAAQRARLEDRVRIYMEDLIDPDNGFGGDFSFSRKAWILERTGLFWHAAFRRELAGRYAVQVLSRYYAAVADEMERAFRDKARTDLYRRRAAWWRSRGLDELHLCNGDRALARLKGGGKQRRLDRPEVLAVLKKGLHDGDVDARRAAVRILSDMGELAAMEAAMKDEEVEIRKAAATTFADKMYLPGLILALKDKASEVSSVAEAVLHVKAESVGPYVRAVRCLADGLKDERTRAFAAEQLRRLSGLTLKDTEAEWRDWVQRATGGQRPGALFEYFKGAGRNKPITAEVLETVDIGMKLQANFPKVWYDYWDKPGIFPPDAEGPFLLRITARLYVPADGSYRLYAKTLVESRARVFIKKREIISPRNDAKLQYVMQAGMPTHRIDLSSPMALKQGLVELVILYSGKEVRNIREGRYDHIVAMSGVQRAGIQLFWSSDNHSTELVPADHLFHMGAAKR